ncbi:unannotated protein [freshwater metagenome]|uniref:Unannotated protein n=1 Tax=freshwater metagenome TaxID=449393 RepID=A0A6J7J3L6_9ZZZZ|nr:LysR family transcriptional regulator [Actinomycetota bacterium]
MDLRQLGYLVALAEDGTFTGAAARSHVSQPSLSQQIQRLEAELGIALVDRTTRRASMTQAGTVLVEHARRAIAEIETARAELADLVGIQSGRLTIGATQTIGSVDLSGLLARFHHRYPGVELTVREGLSLELLDALSADEVDLAFVTTAGAFFTLAGIDPPPGVEMQVVAEEPLVAILPPDHPLAQRRELKVAALRDERFVGFRMGATIRRRLNQVATQAGFTPRLLFETNDVTRIRSLVAEGLGIAILPRSDAERPGPLVAIVPLNENQLVHQVSLAQRSDRHHSPAARAFLEMTLA